jgi:hypothetical protein
MAERSWQGWALLEPDGPIHKVYFSCPENLDGVRGLIKMGWQLIEIRITEAVPAALR